MTIKEEFLTDLDLKTPSILVNGTQAVIDNAKQIVLLSEDSIIIYNSKKYIAVHGRDLYITQLEGQKMYLKGIIDSVEFYGEATNHE